MCWQKTSGEDTGQCFLFKDLTFVLWRFYHLKLDSWVKFAVFVGSQSDSSRPAVTETLFPAAVIPPAFEPLRFSANANWFAAFERTAELYLPHLLIVEAKSRNALFYYYFFAFIAMELIYCSVFLLPCVFLDWALRTSAEEGESDDAETFLCLQFFLPEAICHKTHIVNYFKKNQYI